MVNVIDKLLILTDKFSKAIQPYKTCLIILVNSSLKHAFFNRSDAKTKTIQMGGTLLVGPYLFTVGESTSISTSEFVGETGLCDKRSRLCDKNPD